VSALLLFYGGRPTAAFREAPAASKEAVLTSAVEKLEYRVTERKGGLSAPNRAQGFRLAFSEEGLSINEREGGAPLVAIGLTAFGRAGTQRALSKAPASTAGEFRVERRWEGLTEWFLNLPEGVEHGWTVKERAQGDGPLVLSVTVTGARTVASTHEALFETQSGRVLRYGSLKALDASGATLPAHLFATPDGLALEVDDTAAQYPIVVDPLLTTSTWTTFGNQASARLGASVASAGDVNGDGYSDVIVGAPNFDNGQSNEGRTFVYLSSASGLGPMPAWTAECNQAGASFGASVESAGDVNGDGYSDVVVGAPDFDNGQSNEGRAFVYLGSASGLGLLPAWTAESNQALAYFGVSAAGAGDVNGDGYSDVVVGAHYFDSGLTDEGRVFLYLGSSSGLSPTAAWTAGSNQGGPGPEFGLSVASAGDVNGDGYADVLVGARLFDNGERDEGRVFLYLGNASGLGLTPSWTGESNQMNAEFGATAAGAGDVNGDGYSDVVVGAPNFDNGQTDEGRVFLYLGNTSGLSPMPSWTAENNEATSRSPSSGAGAGDVNGDGYSDVVVGSSIAGGNFGGRAELYLGRASGLSPSPAWTTSNGNQGGALFGVSVASAGDTNGDGYSDVVVGADGFDSVAAEEGAAFLYVGTATGLTPAFPWSAESNQADGSFGLSVANAGDVNGDGYSDVVVGAPGFDNGETDEGRAFLYLGSSNGLSPTPSWSAESNQASANFGWSVASAGDVNGDGYSDVVVGAHVFDNGELNEGRAFLYLGSAGGLSPTPAWTAESNQDLAYFGFTVASAGDVNGDGFSDVVVGAYSFDNGQALEGRAFLYTGNASGLSPTPAWTADSNQAIASFGFSVASAGDVNGDGYSDVVVGASQFDNGEPNEGRAFLYLGRMSGLSPAPSWTAEGNKLSAGFGSSVASAGDVNRDGYSDVVVGAPSFENGQAGEGRAFLFFGSATGLSVTPAWTAESNQAGAFFGNSVASAGDVNGDGYSDVVVGADHFVSGQVTEGRTFLYLGSASGSARPPLGRPRATRLVPCSARASRAPAMSMATASPMSWWVQTASTTVSPSRVEPFSTWAETQLQGCLERSDSKPPVRCLREL
jgi:hypothetical protein